MLTPTSPSSTRFWGLTGEKKNSTSIITKDSLFGTLPPQMAECLMFLSRCVAFFLPRTGCAHNHCLMSKIEGMPCKLWMPPCQRHGTEKTACRHVCCTLETSCSLACGLRGDSLVSPNGPWIKHQIHKSVCVRSLCTFMCYFKARHFSTDQHTTITLMQLKCQ